MSPDELKRHYHQTFTSPAGKVVLEDLINTYDGSPMTLGDPYATAYNVGAQDALRYILSMIDRGNDD